MTTNEITGPVVDDEGNPSAATLAMFGWHTLAEAAAELGVTADTLRHQVQNGRLGAKMVGKTYVVSADEIRRYRFDSLNQPGRKAELCRCSATGFPSATPHVSGSYGCIDHQ